MPGPISTPTADALLRTALTRGIYQELLHPDLLIQAGGMETLQSAYLVLTTRSGACFLLLERLNDDGEYSPQVYPASPQMDADDPVSVLREAARHDDDEEAMTESALFRAEVSASEQLESYDLQALLEELLYDFRDLVSPNAVG